MTYRELVDKGAERTEIQTYLSHGDMLTTTLRIPANLKAAITEEAALQGMSFSSFMRRCAIQFLSNDERM